MFRKKGIKLQVLMSVLILFVIGSTVAIDWFISMNSYKQTLSDYHLDNNYNYVQKLRTTTTHQLNYMSGNIAAIGKDIGKHEYKQEDLDEWFEANKRHFNSLFITDPEGNVQLVSPKKVVLQDEIMIEEDVQLEGEMIEKALKKRSAYISPPDYSLGGELMTLISAPIFDDKTGAYKGMIAGTIHMESDNVLKCILGNHQYADQSYVFVVDPEGKLIYHPEEDRLGEDVAENEVVKQVTKGKDGSQKVINLKGNEFFASYTYLKVADWGIVVQTPTEIIQQPLKDLFWRIVMLTLPFLLIILALSSFIVSRITKPLNTLANFSEKSLREDPAVKDVEQLQLNTFVYEVRLLYNQVLEHLSMLKREATLDGLTQINNRRQFNIAIEQLFTKEQPFSLILLDIDFFKKVNDTYGHVVGDDVLYYLAQTMKAHLGKRCTCYRYGGEEFAILLENKTPAEAYELAESLREKVAGQPSPTGEPIHISLGISERTSKETSAQQVIEKADEALYTSKQSGRNQTTIYKEH